jgi:hypothetical protein
MNRLRCTTSDDEVKRKHTLQVVLFCGRLLATSPTVPLFFTSDLRVMIDILLQQLADLSLSDLVCVCVVFTAEAFTASQGLAVSSGVATLPICSGLWLRTRSGPRLESATESRRC